MRVEVTQICLLQQSIPPKSGHFERARRLSYLILQKIGKITMLSADERGGFSKLKGGLSRSPSFGEALSPLRPRTPHTPHFVFLATEGPGQPGTTDSWVESAPRGAQRTNIGIILVTIFPTKAYTLIQTSHVSPSHLLIF